jgi:hypothetical protein
MSGRFDQRIRMTVMVFSLVTCIGITLGIVGSK